MSYKHGHGGYHLGPYHTVRLGNGRHVIIGPRGGRTFRGRRKKSRRRRR